MPEIKNAGLQLFEKAPEVGAKFARQLVLPSGLTPANDLSGINLNVKPHESKVLLAVNSMASLEVAVLFQSLSTDELSLLHKIGKAVKGHDLGFLKEAASFTDAVAERLFVIQSKSLTTMNHIGPERWRGVLKNLNAELNSTYDNLSDAEKSSLRENVYSVAVSLSSLSPESLELLNGLRNISETEQLSKANSSSALKDFVLKRVSALSFEAWKNRKQLIGADHPDAKKSFHEISPQDRLFAGLMGISSFQMLRESGVDVCFSLLNLGEKLLSNGEIDTAALREDMNSKKIISGLKFKNGDQILLSPDLMVHLRDNHHNIWLANRTLSWLLPPELHQPQRKEHKPVDSLELFDQNQSCMNILCLAITLAQDSKSIDRAQIVRDLLKTAAKSNPYQLDTGIYVQSYSKL